MIYLYVTAHTADGQKYDELYICTYEQ